VADQPDAGIDAIEHVALDGARLRRADHWLGRAGLRPTRQRRTLAALLVGDGAHRHVTAEALHAAARGAGYPVALATVYNTLKCFTEAGLVSEITVDGARSYFDTRTEDHAHFYTEDDGAIADAPLSGVTLDALPEPPEGYEIARVDVVIRLRRRED
jgi:Fur family iron response transcriptional regulator